MVSAMAEGSIKSCGNLTQPSDGVISEKDFQGTWHMARELKDK